VPGRIDQDSIRTKGSKRSDQVKAEDTIWQVRGNGLSEWATARKARNLKAENVLAIGPLDDGAGPVEEGMGLIEGCIAVAWTIQIEPAQTVFGDEFIGCHVLQAGTRPTMEVNDGET